MRKYIAVFMVFLVIFSLKTKSCFAAEPLRKLGRGLVNVITGIVEIPKKVILTSRKEGIKKGFTTGLKEGAKAGLVRTASGIYEALTFPIPAPANYEPMVSPEFVFEEWDNEPKAE